MEKELEKSLCENDFNAKSKNEIKFKTKEEFLKNETKITTISGPMYSGKSGKVIELAARYDSLRQKYICFKPSLDTRILNGVNTAGKIVSRNKKLTVEAVMINKDFEINEEMKKIIDEHNIFIFDETQFLDKKSIENFVEECYKKHTCKEIFFAGLDMDFQGKKFETVAYAEDISNEVDKLRAQCSIKGCDKPATHTAKIGGDSNVQIEIGNDIYKAMCEKHWKQFTKKPKKENCVSK